MADRRSMFGVDNMEEFAATIEQNSLTYKSSGGPVFVVMSILSDAQEEMAHGNMEEARQTLNRAKFLVDRWFSPKEEGEEWTINKGEMPVAKGTLVDVMHRDGDVFTGVPAGEEGGRAHDWSLDPPTFKGDILQWRRHKKG